MDNKKVKVELWNDKCKYKSQIKNGDIYYYMKHKDIYRFKIISTDTRFISVEILSEGVCLGTWVVNANSTCFIERPSKKEQQFCCLRLDSSEAKKNNIQQSDTNGLIEIRIKPFTKKDKPLYVVDSLSDELSFSLDIEADGGSIEADSGSIEADRTDSYEKSGAYELDNSSNQLSHTKSNSDMQRGKLHRATTVLTGHSYQKFEKFNMENTEFYKNDEFILYIRILVEDEEYIPINQLELGIDEIDKQNVRPPPVFPSNT